MRKPIARILAEQEAGGGTTLPRVLGRSNLVLLGVGAVVGTGIFVLTGQAAAAHAGPAIVISMLMAGLVSALAALCYSEFAASVPIAGSAYTYAYATLGEFVAWIIGWDLILEYAVGSMTVAIGWSGYMQRLLGGAGITLPVWMANAPSATTPGALINLPAVLIVLAIMVLLVIGVRESARFNAAMVAIKLAAVLFFLAVGVTYVEPANWQPFAPFGWTGIMS
ncbi:MAG: amino acid permease, partial [Panacagrimonas sp.]